jgi:hypothetical protein
MKYNLFNSLKPQIQTTSFGILLFWVSQLQNGGVLILVSQRGVVFFRSQEITSKQQEKIGIKLGELSGKPSTSKLHIHPLTAEFSEFGDYISVISSEFNRISHDAELDDRSLLASGGWHSE